jgi:hypothetical protein
MHLRRIHYLLVSQEQPVTMRDGRPYQNTDFCYIRMNEASKFARHLRLVPPSAIVDRRNDNPILADTDEDSVWLYLDR